MTGANEKPENARFSAWLFSGFAVSQNKISVCFYAFVCAFSALLYAIA